MYHFKDRKPEETIQIIKNFFENKNYTIYKKFINQSCANTYFSHFILYWKNNIVVTSNGKGLTKELCEASGLAELYERFCFLALNNGFVSKKMEDVFKNREYQLISNEDFFNDEYTKKYLQIFLPEYNKEYVDKFINTFYNKKIYGNKFINLNDKNDIIYKNSNILFFVNTTTGLAAGNTLEEALVQGISEIYERLVVNYYYQKNNIKYYKINNSILPQNLQNIINKAEQNDNCKISIFDLSYTFNLPVVLSLYQDLTNNTFYLNFGSSPIFEIAVERCLTELYQGYKYHEYKTKITYLNNELPQNYISQQQNLSANIKQIILPEDLLFNSYNINDFNKEIYFNINQLTINNQTLLEHIQKINKINNLNFYYSDISLSNNIKAVQIITKNIINESNFYFISQMYNSLPKNELYILFKINLKIMDIFNKIIYTNNISDNDINNLFLFIMIMSEPLIEKNHGRKNTQIYLLNNFEYMHSELFNLYKGPFDYNHLSLNNILLILNTFYEIDNFPINNGMTLFPQVQIWTIIKKLKNKNYSKEKIQKIINFLNFNINIDNINIEEINGLFIIKQLANYLYNMYNNKEYYEFIESLKPELKEED